MKIIYLITTFLFINTTVFGTVSEEIVCTESTANREYFTCSLGSFTLNNPNSIAVGATSISFTWTTPSGIDAGTTFTIQRRIGTGSWTSGTGCSNKSSGTTSCTMTGLTAGTTYEFRVMASSMCDPGIGEPLPKNFYSSNTIIETTEPNAPTLRAATPINSTDFTARWYSTTGATGYYIDVATSSNFLSGQVLNNSYVSGGSSIYKYVSGLTPGTTYYYRVRAYNATGGQSVNVSPLSATTEPLAPVVAAGSSVTSSSFTANWNTSSGATSYKLDVATNNTFSNYVSGYYNLTVNGGGTTSKSVASLLPGTDYFYRVRAVTSGGTSGSSSYQKVTTIASAPVVNSATLVSNTGFTANWAASSGAVSYSLDVSSDNFNSLVTGYENLNVGNVTSHSVTNLDPGTSYSYRVRAVNDGGTSTNSGISETETLPDVPVAISASLATSSSFTANWNAANGATNYRLDVSDDVFSSYLDGFENLTVSGTSKEITNLEAGIVYYYRVRAVNSTGNVTANSNTIGIITIPSAPVLNNPTSITINSMTLNWGGATGASGYELDIATTNSFDAGTFLTGYENNSINSTSHSVSGLASGTVYHIRVRAINSSGTSGNSTIKAQITLPLAPVTNDATDISSSSFLASWVAPTGTEDYRLDVSIDDFNSFVTDYNNLTVSGTSQLVEGLEPGNTYSYRVRAVNAAGASENSSNVELETLPELPVTIAATSITTTSFNANWEIANGASDYQLDVSTDGFNTFIAGFNSLSVLGTSKLVTGLTAGTIYSYRVRAVNNFGSVTLNSNSTLQITISNPAVANAATNISETGFTASWNSPTGAESYKLDVSEDNFSTFVDGYQDLSVSGNSQEITGLEPSTVYSYRVRVVNAGGTSENSNAPTLETLPEAPVAINATAISTTSFLAQWEATNGATNYLLDVSTDNFNSFVPGFNGLIVSGTSETVTGLSAGTNYSYRVRAINGNSGISANSNVISQITIPDPSVLNAITTISQTSFDANWNASTGAVGYLIDVSTSNSFDSFVSGYENLIVSGTSIRIEGLTKGTTHYMRISAYNDAGESDYSNTASALTIPSAPILNESTTVEHTGFSANWNAVVGKEAYYFDLSVSSEFNSFVAGYENLSVIDEQVDVTGLLPGTQYFFRVRAENATGLSGNSNIVSILTKPAAPVATEVTDVSQTSFVANWNEVEGVDNYLLDVSEYSNFSSFVSGYEAIDIASLSHELTDLNPGTIYFYRVRAINATGESINSNSIEQITIPLTPEITGVQDQASDKFKLVWTDVEGESHFEIMVASDADFTNLIEGNNPKIVSNLSNDYITGLQPETVYYTKIRAVNAGGNSPYSGVETTLTAGSNGEIASVNISTPIEESGNLTFNVSKGAVPVAKVILYHKMISESEYQSIELSTSNLNFSIPMEDQWMDELGIEYYIEVSDILETKVVSGSIRASIDNVEIPISMYGKDVKNYHIISIPYELNSQRVEDVFEKIMGVYDKSKWRLVQFRNNKNIDYQDGLSVDNVRAGEAFWFISTEEKLLSLGNGIMPEYNSKKPFVFQLKQGWNQIGNPFPKALSWESILAANPDVTGVGSLITYDNTTSTLTEGSDLLQKFRGGFVFAETAITVNVPVNLLNSDGGRKGGRIAQNSEFSEASREKWLLPLTLKQGDAISDLSAIGMHPEASLSKDKFDRITPPRFIKYLELVSRHEDYFVSKFSQDIIPSRSSHSWNFEFNQNFGSDEISLQWDNSLINDLGLPLLLYDKTNNIIVDMLIEGAYHFVGNNLNFEIVLSEKPINLTTSVITMGTAFPNPSKGIIHIPFANFDTSSEVKGQFMLYDNMGNLLVNNQIDNVETGLNEYTWEGHTNSNDKVPAGVYIYKLLLHSSEEIKSFEGKIILN